jgi:hypothetical protein
VQCPSRPHRDRRFFFARLRVECVLEDAAKEPVVQPGGGLERIDRDAVTEREPRSVEEVGRLDRVVPVERRKGLGALQDRDVGAMARDASAGDEPGDGPVQVRCDGDGSDAVACGLDRRGELRLLVRPAGGETGGVGGERLASAQDLRPASGLGERVDADA